MSEVPEEDLQEGQIYELTSRNLIVGVWRPQTRGFVGLRVKFKGRYLFEEYHWNAGPPFGTARAIRELDGFRIPKRLLRRYDPTKTNVEMFNVLDALDKLLNRTIVLEDSLKDEYGMRTYDMTRVRSDSVLTPKSNFTVIDSSNQKVAWGLADMYERRAPDAERVYPVVVRRRVTEWEVVKRDLDEYPVKE